MPVGKLSRDAGTHAVHSARLQAEHDGGEGARLASLETFEAAGQAGGPRGDRTPQPTDEKSLEAASAAVRDRTRPQVSGE